MTPLEIAAKAVRKEFVDHIVDHANPHWGPHKPDHLVDTMRKAGYADAEKAADFFAAAAAKAALLALAGAPLPDLPSRLYQDDALRDWLRIIAEDRLTESTATNAPVQASHEAPPLA